MIFPIPFKEHTFISQKPPCEIMANIRSVTEPVHHALLAYGSGGFIGFVDKDDFDITPLPRLPISYFSRHSSHHRSFRISGDALPYQNGTKTTLKFGYSSPYTILGAITATVLLITFSLGLFGIIYDMIVGFWETLPVAILMSTVSPLIFALLFLLAYAIPARRAWRLLTPLLQ